jgi:hypothetical protein
MAAPITPDETNRLLKESRTRIPVAKRTPVFSPMRKLPIGESKSVEQLYEAKQFQCDVRTANDRVYRPQNWTYPTMCLLSQMC